MNQPPLQQTFITTHEENASEMEDGELSQDESPINSEAETAITEPARNEKVPTTPIVDNRGKSIYLHLDICPAKKVRKMLKFRSRFTTLRFTITRFTRTREEIQRDSLKLTFETEEDSDRMREQLKNEPISIKHCSIRYRIQVVEKCDTIQYEQRVIAQCDTIQENNTEHMDTEEKRSTKRKIHPDEHYRTKYQR